MTGLGKDNFQVLPFAPLADVQHAGAGGAPRYWSMGSSRTRTFNGRRAIGTIPKGCAIDHIGTTRARNGGGDCPAGSEMPSLQLQKPRAFRQGTDVTNTASQGRGLKEILFKILI